jgi:hypothetical protein
MKINKVIFSMDDNPIYADFWPIQANLVKTILKAEPVLFYITDEDSNFYFDGNGLVKKINKNNCPNIITSFQSQIVRMYGTKYFQDEICMTADIDMLMINENYFSKQIENFNDESLVIMDSKAYDLERTECQNHNESCENRYPICYIIGKGKNFNKVLNTDRNFEEYVDDLQKLRLGWGTDELYFGDKVDNTNHGVNVVKLVRNYTTPWKAEKRIDRHNFPVILKHCGEIELQKKDGFYNLDKLKLGFYIDAHCPRPYNEYKNEIDKLVEIINNMKKFNFDTFIKPYKKSLIDSDSVNRMNYYDYILNKLYSLNKPITIVETGTMWNGLEDNQGAFTLIFADFIKNYTGGKIITVDISTDHINNCREFTKKFSDVIEYVVSDSVSYLKSLEDNFVSEIDLIFFDSYDVNLHEPLPSEIHHLRELLSVYDRLSENVSLAVDDNLMPGNWVQWITSNKDGNIVDKTVIKATNEIIGKGTLINRFLLDNNWKRINDTSSYCLLGYERNNKN